MIVGKVISGKTIGRTLGFPTANILLASDDQTKDGVYAAVATVGQLKFNGMAFVGKGHEGSRVLEINIFELEEDLYGKQIAVDLVHFLRTIIHFSSPTELAAQLEEDKKATLNYFNKYYTA